MRKSASIILLSCLFIYQSGYMLLYVFQLLEVKQEMQVYIKDHPTEHGQFFSFQLNEGKVADKHFEWEEDKQEFSYQGKMYDVVDMKVTGHLLTIHAYNDQKEEQLQADLAKHHRQNQNPALSQLVSMVFLIQKNEFDLNPAKAVLSYFQNRTSPKPRHVELAIQSPPPDVV